MPRKQLRRWLQPTRDFIAHNRFLKPLSPVLSHDKLWRLTPHSIGGGIVAGAFAGLIPGPLQIVSAIVLSVIFRVNMPVAVAFTFYSNPITIIPIYLAALTIGSWITHDVSKQPVDFPDLHHLSFHQWSDAITTWLSHMGWPFVIGLFCIASVIGVTGYCLVQIIWRLHVYFRIQSRKRKMLAANPKTDHS
ncbi:DUF2062 domain-containing protein [Leeia oryzae]|uniref:DUF2062 domain-containing protein n=1 Tax=Leeia oryzae TaxID=356662 RepID=UPI00037A9D50|nr:DUF2062 domain-containing protein [Leeia oryzae]